MSVLDARKFLMTRAFARRALEKELARRDEIAGLFAMRAATFPEHDLRKKLDACVAGLDAPEMRCWFALAETDALRALPERVKAYGAWLEPLAICLPADSFLRNKIIAFSNTTAELATKLAVVKPPEGDFDPAFDIEKPPVADTGATSDYLNKCLLLLADTVANVVDMPDILFAHETGLVSTVMHYMLDAMDKLSAARNAKKVGVARAHTNLVIDLAIHADSLWSEIRNLVGAQTLGDVVWQQSQRDIVALCNATKPKAPVSKPKILANKHGKRDVNKPKSLQPPKAAAKNVVQA